MMNETLQAYARDELKKGLSRCVPTEIMLFKRMYSPTDTMKPINEVVDDMPYEKLDWAMQQVERTIELHEQA